MPFTARSAAEIRDDLLSVWAAKYRIRGQDLAIDRDSDAYAEADALSLTLEGLEIQAQQNGAQVLLRRASGGALDDFAEDDGTARKGAVTARRHVSVSGPVSTTTALAGQYLTTSSGTRFNPINADGSALASIVTDSSGAAVILVECAVTGSAGSISTSTVLTWSSPPTSFASTGTVTSTTTNRRDGAEREDDSDLRARLLELRRERPASANRADWREKVREVTGVSEAFVYPLAAPVADGVSLPATGTPSVPGCVTVLAVGPVQSDADNPTNTRFVIGGAASAGLRCSQIEDFIEGDRDADLSVTTTGRQWRPASLPQGNYTVKTPRKQTQDVDLRITPASSTPFPFTYDAGFTVHSSSDTTHLVVDGDHTAKDSKAVLVRLGTSVIRGGYAPVTLTVGSYNGGTNRTTWTVAAMAGAPVAGSVVLPAPPAWVNIKAAVLAYFDALGPGEYSYGYVASARFPAPEDGSPSTLHPTALAARVITEVSTVLACTTSTPSTATTPVDEYLLDLGYLIVRSA